MSIPDHPLAAIGFRAGHWPDFVLPDGRRLGRIVEQHRSGYLVHDGSAVIPAKPLPKLRHQVADASQRPAVGDWAVLVQQGDEWLVEALLPRFSALTRGAAGEKRARQAIASNIDHILIVCGLDRDFNPRRIERYLALASASGARPTLVLTKLDKDPRAAELLEQARAVAGSTAVHAVNAKDPASCAALAALLESGQTAVLVGSSGAGKSTLTNTLLGGEIQATGAIRERDGRGRHTTVARTLLPLPGGACLIDTPGLREIKLTGDEQLEEAGFDEIDALAADCRFRDCRHEKEPGCKVREALEAGAIDPARLASWHKLGREIGQAGSEGPARRAHKRESDAGARGLRKRRGETQGRR
jgi:ribosome biogenesis GTPase